MQSYLFVLIGYLVSTVFGQYYFVTFPNVIRFNNDETVSVNIFGLTSARVEVWLEVKEGNNVRRFSERTVWLLTEHTPAIVHVKVTEDNILPDDKDDGKPTSVTVCSRYENHQDCQEIPLSYETGHLIIQTDKSIYKPNQRVSIRALAFDESLVVVNDEIWMDIISPSDQILDRVLKQNSSNGFYRHSFDLPSHPEFGVWTATAYLKGQYETTTKATFQVMEYVQPMYGVTIEVNVPFILPDTTEFKIAVKARYVNGKPVNGNARLDMYLSGKEEDDKLLLSTKKRALFCTGDDHSIAVFNVETSDIMNATVVNKIFPEGKRFKVIATVYEEDTGTEENDLHDKTLFTRSAFRFKFTRSKMNFRPGMEYVLKVDLSYPNDVPVSDQAVDIELVGKKVVKVLTDSNGRASATFETTHTTINTNIITFKVRTNEFGRDWESDEFRVNEFKGKNQIEVKLATVASGNELLAYTNAQGQLYTGMLFMVVTRGKIVKTEFKRTGNKVSVPFTNSLKKNVSPSGRLLVFYVDKGAQGEIVVDSVKFDVEHVCRGKELTLTPENSQIHPGVISNLQISGDKNMSVGLNIMDKALLLQNNKNILERNMLFDTLDSHDLGCGEGSGSNSADIFKRAGLTVLTNAKIDKNSLKGKAEECDLKHRARRLAENSCSGENQVCCEEGESYANEVLDSKPKKIGLFTTCYSKSRSILKKDKIHSSIKCATALFFSCIHILTRKNEGKLLDPKFRSSGLFDTNPYTEDLSKALEIGSAVRIRRDFSESWEFTEWGLDGDGNREISLKYPDSITEWMIQAVGISSEGVCIAEPANVKAFRKFFIRLYLPYKAKRLEQLEVKATVFNYSKNNMTANVYLIGSKDLCYDSEAGIAKPSKITTVFIPSHNAQTVRYPVIPLKKGQLDVRASALIATGFKSYTDEVVKPLLVVNEGIEEKITFQVCLDPHRATDCKQDKRVILDEIIVEQNEPTQVLKVSLDLPDDAIPNTGSGTGYVQGVKNDIQTLLQEGVEYILKRPAGDGETTMMFLAANVYAINYMEKTRTMDTDTGIKGIEYIRYGIIREASMYRHPDGSYSAWLHRQPSTWLTAFVAKVFCQAKRIVDDAVYLEEDIRIILQWLVNKMEADGSYIENMPVVHRNMIGQVKDVSKAKHPSLAAFVLISLQECTYYVKAFQEDVQKTIEYVENLDKQMLRNNPFLLAISTYALALSKSTKRYDFLKMLNDIKISSANNGMHWGNAGGHPASANSVETTSYALLAMLQFQDYTASGEIVKWLTSQRDGQGAFRTTQDTVVGLQALSEYAYRIRRDILKLNLKVPLSADKWEDIAEITYENVNFQNVIKNLPIDIGKKELTIKVTGRGIGRMMINLRYYRLGTRNETCRFTVSDIIVSEVNELNQNLQQQGLMVCDVCAKNCERKSDLSGNLGRKKRSRGRSVSYVQRCIEFSVRTVSGSIGMAVVKFELETGVHIISNDIDKLIEETENIDAYENNGKGFVVFYLSEVTTVETRFKFRLKDTFDDKVGKLSRQPAVVTVYDYNNPDVTCTKMYRSIGETFSMKCDNSSSSMTCHCMSNSCPSAWDEKLVEQEKGSQRPALQLKQYTCNINNADFAVLVLIEKIKELEVNAIVTKNHLQLEGKNDLTDEKIVLLYQMDCQFPKFTVGNEYYIIGKESIKENEYVLSSSTLVIGKPPPGAMLDSIMKEYENFMERGCFD